MKKMMFLFLSAVFALSATAQDVTRRVKVSDFTGISAGSVFDITLIRANSCSVEIVCPKEVEEALDVKVSGGNLVLMLKTDVLEKKVRHNFRGSVRAVVRMPVLKRLQLSGAARLSTTSVFDGAGIEMGLSGASSATGLNFTVDRVQVETSGGSRFDMKGTFKEASYGLSGGSAADLKITADNLKIGASGGANINMAVKCERITIGMSGGVRITASGETGSLNAGSSGGACLEAVELKANDVTLEGSGATQLRVWAVQNLNVNNLSGAASVRYTGDPRFGTLRIDRGSFEKLNP